MTTATELAMNLADLKLRLRQVSGPHTGKHSPFDDGIKRAIHWINKAIVESVDAVHNPNVPPGSRRRRSETVAMAALRHEKWARKQIHDGKQRSTGSD